MSPATPPLLSSVRPMKAVKPQLEKVPATVPRHANCGRGVFVGWGGLVAVGLLVGLLVGLGVGLGVLVGVGVSVGAGVGVAVKTIGVLVGSGVGVAVSVGVGVSLGWGVWVAVDVTVKVGLGVLVGVGVGCVRASRPPGPQASMPAIAATTTTDTIIRFCVLLITPPTRIIRRSDTVLR